MQKIPAKPPAFTKTVLLETRIFQLEILNQFDKYDLYPVCMYIIGWPSCFSYTGLFSLPSQSMEKQGQLLKHWSCWKQKEFCLLTLPQSLSFLASEFTRITELTFLMGPSHRQDLRNNAHVVAGIHSLNNIKEKQGNSQTLFHWGTDEHLRSLGRHWESFPTSSPFLLCLQVIHV